MKAMIFSAGLGTRLYPITKNIPKALAPFQSTSLLHYNLSFLANQGVNEFVVNTHHFAGEIEEYLRSHKNFGFNISLSHEEELLNTAGGLAYAAHFFKNTKSPILLYNVDVISNINLKSMLTYHRTQNNAISLAVRNRETNRYLLFDQNKVLCGWKNKSTGEKILKCKEAYGLSALAFSGIQLISPGVLSLLENGRVYSLIDFYLENMNKIKISAFEHMKDYWFDCGKPEKLMAAQQYIQALKH